MLARKLKSSELDEETAELAPMYATRELCDPIPRYQMPQHGMPARSAYQLIHDELNLDGNPALNLASFVTTWMEPEADQLMAESFGRNFVDADEYPQTTEIHNRCVNMVARLFHAHEQGDAVGCATVGSSEAIHLAALALKWRWRARRRGEGKPADAPNIVFGANVQVCWEKFARYWDVEPRFVRLAPDRYVMGVDEAMALVDENTIGVVGILGSTYTGEFEPISELNDALVELNARNGWDVALHVDAASGGFVAPFTRPELEWDFRLPTVHSINASGHKYGLVYPGVGWVVWRSEEDLPDELIFHVNYLGGDQPTFSLNFSKGSGQILAQYYNFLRLGTEGYTDIMQGLEATASYFAKAVESMDRFEILSRPGTLPLVCWRLAEGVGRGPRPYTVFDIAAHLRERGWIVPAYTLAPDAQDIAVLRVVVREGFSRDIAGMLADDLKRTVEHLESHGPVHLGTSHARPGRPTLAAAARSRPRPKADKTTRGVC